MDLPPEFWAFVAIGLAAQLVDGALGMAYGITSSSLLLALGLPPALASASVHAAEVATTGVSGRVRNARRASGPRRNVRNTSTPSMPGIWISIKTRSKLCSHSARNPSEAPEATAALHPSCRSIWPMTS